MKPVLFLDVDGVLNSFGSSPWDLSIKHKVFFAPHNTHYPITTSTLIGKALMELDIEIRWLTTWRDHANTHISFLAGLPEDLPVAFTDAQYEERLNKTGSGGWGGLNLDLGIPWKLQTILNFIKDEPGRPFIWADDDAIPYDANAIVVEGIEGPPQLLIRPDDRFGLTPDHIQEMRDFLSSLS